jgi:hypothetical protein
MHKHKIIPLFDLASSIHKYLGHPLTQPKSNQISMVVVKNPTQVACSFDASHWGSSIDCPIHGWISRLASHLILWPFNPNTSHYPTPSAHKPIELPLIATLHPFNYAIGCPIILISCGRPSLSLPIRPTVVLVGPVAPSFIGMQCYLRPSPNFRPPSQPASLCSKPSPPRCEQAILCPYICSTSQLCWSVQRTKNLCSCLCVSLV